VQVLCEHCGRAATVADTAEGAVACPHCHKPIQLPAGDRQPSDDRTEAFAELDGFAAVARSVRAGRIEFICRKCGKRMAAPLQRAGQRVACIRCGVRVTVPRLDAEQPRDEKARGKKTRGKKAPAKKPTGGAASEDIFDGDLELTDASVDPWPVAPGSAKPQQPESERPPPSFPADDQLAQAADAATAARRRAKTGGSRSSLKWALCGVGGAAVIAAGVILYVLNDTGDGGAFLPETPSTESPAGAENLADADADIDIDVEPLPPVIPDDPPDVGKPEISVAAVARDVLASAGYLVAPLGQEYWKVTAQVAGGGKTIVFRSFGPDVTLAVGGKTYEAMGAIGQSVFPLTGLRADVHVAGDETRTLTFLFQLPTSARSSTTGARLSVVNVGQADLAVPPPPPAVSAETLVGDYVELRPRNLKALMSDPVASAIQRQATHTLVIRREGDGLVIELPAAKVTGTPGDVVETMVVRLHRGEHSMGATLRVVDGGRRLILYLSRQPFGQLTFARAGAPVSPPDAAIQLQADAGTEPGTLAKPIHTPGDSDSPTKPDRTDPTGGGKTIFDP